MIASLSRPRIEIRPSMKGMVAFEAASQVLTIVERAEASRFLRSEDRQRFVAARSLLREMAGSALGAEPQQIRIERDALSRPRLVEMPDCDCNVTHSGGLVAAALGRGCQIGIDIEQHRSDLDLDVLAATFMTSVERKMLSAARGSAKVDVFFRQWCFKEALVKALGTGLTLDPKRFEIIFTGDRVEVRFVGKGRDDIGGGWRLEALDVPAGYSGAVAWR